MNKVVQPRPRNSRVAQNPAFRRALRRYLLLIAGLVFGAAAVAGYLNPGSRAQTVSDNSEAAFAQKADKTLKLIRAAVAMDRAAVAKGRFAQPQSMVDQTARFAAITRSGSLTNVAVIVSLAGANTDQLKTRGLQFRLKWARSPRSSWMWISCRNLRR